MSRYKLTASRKFQRAKKDMSAFIANTEKGEKVDTVFYKEPNGYQQALKTAERMYWKDAMESEIDSINAHHDNLQNT